MNAATTTSTELNQNTTITNRKLHCYATLADSIKEGICRSSSFIVVRSSRFDLLNADLTGLRSLGLGNKDAQDTVLETSLDGFLVDTSREGEGAVELSD